LLPQNILGRQVQLAAGRVCRIKQETGRARESESEWRRRREEERRADDQEQ
jgi:hypothetical protein